MYVPFSSYNQLILNVPSALSEKDNKKLRLDLLLGLLEKIETLDDSVLSQYVLDLIGQLDVIKPEGHRNFNKSFTKIRNYVSKNHKLYAKGDLQQTYMAVGIGVGVAIGAGLMTINSGFIELVLPSVSQSDSLSVQQKKNKKKKKGIYNKKNIYFYVDVFNCFNSYL